MIEINLTNGRQVQVPPKLLTQLNEEERKDAGAVYGVIEGMAKAQQELNDMMYRFLRTVPNELRDAVVDIANAIPGDRNDVFELTATGDEDEELTITHELGYEPEFLEVVGRHGGYGQVTQSREALSDKENLYLKTNAPEGTVLKVRVY